MMTTLGFALLAALLAIGGLAGLSAVAGRLIEKAAPPQGRFLEVDGERLHVLDVGEGPPVVLIHGLGGQMGNFTHSLVGRLRADFRVVAFDRPGSGYSTRSPKAPPNFRAEADTLASAIRALKLDRPLVVGHSFGGAVALALALDHPDCVGALALVSPATHPPDAAPRAFRALAIQSRMLRRLFAWTVATPAGLIASKWTLGEVFAPESPPADFGTKGGGLLALRPGNVWATSSDLVAALASRADLEDITRRYASIGAPVGILYGRGDQVLDWRAQGEAMKQKIPSLDLEIVEGGHMLPVTQPDLVAAFIRRMAGALAKREESRAEPGSRPSPIS